MPRIVITGTHATGKTSLAQALAFKLGVPLISEVVRELCQKLNIPPYHTLNRQVRHRFQRMMIQWQIIQESKHKDFVADRSVIDPVAYLFTEGGILYDTEMKEVMNHMGSFDLVVLIPPEFAITEDGFRSTDPQYQIDVHEQFVKLLVGKPNVISVSGSVKERVDQVLKELYDRHIN